MPVDQMPELDRWALSRLNALSEWAVWAGFAANTFLLVVLINTGCLDMLIAGLSGTAAAPAYVSPAFG